MGNMKTLLLTILTYYIPVLLARGPHHPQGGHVVKRHTHYVPKKDGEKLTQDDALLQDQKHLEEHLDELGVDVDVSQMTPEDRARYYFLLHDTDKNAKLDGLEMLKAIVHTIHDEVETDEREMDEEETDEEETDEENTYHGYIDLTDFIEMVDDLFKTDDKNDDGYLDYGEFVDGRKQPRYVSDELERKGCIVAPKLQWSDNLLYKL